MKTVSDGFKLENGVMIPCVALGTWESADGEQCYNSVLEAFKQGYTHIDTAKIYGNEVSVGKAIKDSGLRRESLFITTKLWNTDRGSYDEAIQAFETSMNKLDLEYLDLYLIHWPNPEKYRDNWQHINAESWRAMEDLYLAGKIKAIGVSNFMINHLEELEKTARVKPMVNQIRLCPGDTKDELVKYCQDKNIILEAYSPFARGEVFKIDELKELAASKNKTISQVVLRWCLQKGFVSLPKSVTPSRIKENTEIFDFELNDAEISKIDKVQTTYDSESNEPDTIDF
ncbi:aldo/keto reductase [Erysipelotrichaceae bacterium OttesenSCG-928-M19]|nr:aldo/keto reductase [Erysipelotrichaceae bacterium OttesenSCG-928-M19]